MRNVLKVLAAVIFCVGLAGGASLALTDPAFGKSLGAFFGNISAWMPASAGGSPTGLSATATTTSPAPAGFALPLFGAGGFETGGFSTAGRFTGPIADRGSIEQMREAIATRAQRGIDASLAELRSIPKGDPARGMRAAQSDGNIAYLLMYEGKFADAASWTERAIADAEFGGAPPGLRANLRAMLGVIHMRRGETENCIDCLGPSSCIFPIAAEAVHLKTSGSREAIRHFNEYLRERPDDLGVRWLANVAYMTLGEYPGKVPADLLIPLEPFRSKRDIGRFENIAATVGLNARGPNMAGGSVFDDFTGDGLPDVFTTSVGVDLGASLFVNLGNGLFEDRSERAGLKAQTYALNAAQADFDNDGRLDVLLLRGGWENPARLSLLRNTGDGVFEDVTLAAGLGEPIASHSAAWGDFDNDGRLDLFVCGEFAASASDGLFSSDNSLTLADSSNRCRLYRNKGDGTFVNVAEQAGVGNDRYAKAAVCGDYDGDGFLDIYVSNFHQDNRLYHNRGDWTFEDVAPRLGVTEPSASFSCAFLDADNDGRLDLFVTDYGTGLHDWVATMLGRPTELNCHPRLFKNMGASGFNDVSLDMGLDKVALAMGLGVGDLDNDGFLDLYLGTGRPDYSALMPNILYKNVEGRRFEDVTESSGTGHLQKGHGVSFADWDCDGDLDLFVEVGGAVPGDKANNLLFQNPGHGRHWLKVKLVGTRTNRAGLGARIRVDLKQPDGTTRSVHRSVGGASSYGGSSLVESIGLGDGASLITLTVTWPASRTTQTFHHLTPDTAVEITEGLDTFRVLNLPPLSAPPKPGQEVSTPAQPAAPGR
jgi:hypothetical protein